MPPTGGTNTIDITRDQWLLDNPATDKNITIAHSYPAVDNGEELRFTVANLASGRLINLLRENGTNPITFTGATGCSYGSALFRLTSGVWRLVSFDSQGTPTATTGQPNNP